MPTRLIRLQQAGHTHFITFTCYHRMQFLTEAQTCRAVVQSLEHTRQRYRMCVYGFVLMPEHTHLLVSEPEHGTLACALQSLKSASARVARKSEPRLATSAAHFWQTRLLRPLHARLRRIE